MTEEKKLAERYVNGIPMLAEEGEGFSRTQMQQAFIAGLKTKTQWHDLRENPDDLPKCGEDKQIIFYVKEWYENISKYRNHYCLGFYKKAFLNDDVKVFVEKSKGYENEHLPKTVLRWCELPTVKE